MKAFFFNQFYNLIFTQWRSRQVYERDVQAVGMKGKDYHDPDDKSLDVKEKKKVAKEMMKMLGTINYDYVGKPDEDARVICWTYHRGKNKPEKPGD